MTAAEWLEFAANGQPPVRLCCGQRHWGVQCPDGLVMLKLDASWLAVTCGYSL